MKYFYMSVLTVFACVQFSIGATREELEEKVLNIYSGDFVYSAERELTFSNLPPVSVFVYIQPEYDVECNLWEFSRKEADGNYTLLLPADLNPKGAAPWLYYVKTKEDASGADIILMSKFYGTGLMWSKNVYRYTGDSLTFEARFWGYEDLETRDPVTGEVKLTAPTWWDPDGTPMTNRDDRYKQDEQGNTWRLVADEVVEEDTTPASRKATIYRQDPETGHWWKRLTE